MCSGIIIVGVVVVVVADHIHGVAVCTVGERDCWRAVLFVVVVGRKGSRVSTTKGSSEAEAELS